MYPTEAINEAMGRERLTNASLGKKASLDPATISRIRNGEANVNLPTLKKVADALKLRLDIRFITMETGEAEADVEPHS